jgi:hypothetical protein
MKQRMVPLLLNSFSMCLEFWQRRENLIVKSQPTWRDRSPSHRPSLVLVFYAQPKPLSNSRATFNTAEAARARLLPQFLGTRTKRLWVSTPRDIINHIANSIIQLSAPSSTTTTSSTSTSRTPTWRLRVQVLIALDASTLNSFPRAGSTRSAISPFPSTASTALS